MTCVRTPTSKPTSSTPKTCASASMAIRRSSRAPPNGASISKAGTLITSASIRWWPANKRAAVRSSPNTSAASIDRRRSEPRTGADRRFRSNGFERCLPVLIESLFSTGRLIMSYTGAMMSSEGESLFEAFLNQHDDAAWRATVQKLLPAIHEVDRAATQIWFYFYPLALRRALQQADNPQALAKKLLLQGKYDLKDQID